MFNFFNNFSRNGQGQCSISSTTSAGMVKQYQNEVNELRAKKLARNANPLALVATAQASQDQYYQTSRHKGKEIAKPITPPSETAFEEDSDPEQAQKDKDMQKNLALIAKYFKKIYKPTNNNLRTSSNSKNKNVDTTPREKVGSQVVQKTGIQCFNCKEYGHFAKECRNPKRVKDSTYHKEKMLLCKKAEQCVPLQAEQADWLADTDEEVDEQELKVHYSYMAKIQEVPNADSGTDSEPVEQVQHDTRYNVFANSLQHFEQSELVSNTCLMETDDSNVTPDSPDMCEDDIQNDQNDAESDDERVALANLIANLKLDVDENKRIQKQLKKANTTLAQELKECKTILAETSKSLGESISVRDRCLVALQTKQTKFEKYKAFNDRNIAYDKLEHLFRAPTAHDMEILIQTCLMPLAIKTQSDSLKFDHELKQEMHADLKYIESLEKGINELKSDKAEFLDMYDVILQECVSKDVMCSYLMSLSDLDALDELQSSNGFRKEREQYIKIQDLKAKLQDKNISISELKKLIEKGNGKYVDTKFDRPSVVRQPNAQRIPKPSVLSKPTPFSNSLDRIYFQKTESVPKANVSEGLSKTISAQTLPQKAKKAVSNINVLKPGMYRIDNRTAHTRAPQLPQTVKNSNLRMSTSTGVNHKPTVSRPPLKSNKLKDKVLLNNSQVKAKKTQVEVHPRIPSVSNKMKPVTTCKDSLNSRTLNANAVCATCNKCLVDSNHFACVTKMLNDVHDRTKKPNVVPISTRKPKSQANKLTATPNKKKIVKLVLLIVDSGCTKHMTGNLKLLCNFVEKFLGNVCFGNDQFAPILGYEDLVQGNVTINRVYYVKGLNHNLFSVGQFCDADLEVAFRKSTCFVRDLQGNDLLTGCSKFKGRINLLHMDLCGSMRVASINGKKYILVIVDDYSRYTWTLFLRSKGTEFLNKTLNAFFKEEGIEHQTSTARTPEQNSVIKRRNRTLVEAARMMLSASQLPLFFRAEAIATACYTQNRSIIILTRGKTPYHIINDRKPSVKHLHIFGCICYLTRDGENLDKMKQKRDQCILVGYSTQSKGYRASFSNDKRRQIMTTLTPMNFSIHVQILSTNIQSTSAPSTHTNMHTEENNNDQAEEGEHVPDDEFINPFCTPVQKVAENSSHNIDPEMCMYALTVSTVEPKNIKEAIADSAWIEAMQEELHQFDRLRSGNSLTNHLANCYKAKMVMEKQEG
nr:Gag-Pol polyprotein [Tanacetum cinerariifolium]